MMPSRFLPARRRAPAGFLLLEVVLATMIFVVGVIALGRCMGNCLSAQNARGQEDRARLALENRMAEIQASQALPDQEQRSVLKGMFTGITVVERRKTLDVKNEENVPLANLHEITLTAQWPGPHGQTQTRSISFTLLRGQG